MAKNDDPFDLDAALKRARDAKVGKLQEEAIEVQREQIAAERERLEHARLQMEHQRRMWSADAHAAAARLQMERERLTAEKNAWSADAHAAAARLQMERERLTAEKNAWSAHEEAARMKLEAAKAERAYFDHLLAAERGLALIDALATAPPAFAPPVAAPSEPTLPELAEKLRVKQAANAYEKHKTPREPTPIASVLAPPTDAPNNVCEDH